MHAPHHHHLPRQNFYRFRKTEVEKLSLVKGEDSWYTIYDSEMQQLFCCHVLGNYNRGMTAHPDREDLNELFRLEPKGKLLNMTYFVSVPGQSEAMATIKLFVSREMRVFSDHDSELFRVVDSRAPLDKFMTEALEGACTSYKIACNESCIGDFKRHKRATKNSSETKGLIRRSIGKLLEPGSDWCLNLGDNAHHVADHRPLLATMVLLLEHTIRLDQAS